MNKLLNETLKKHGMDKPQLPKKPEEGKCTGCSEEFEDEELDCVDECPDCGYMTCENCASDSSRGGSAEHSTKLPLPLVLSTAH